MQKKVNDTSDTNSVVLFVQHKRIIMGKILDQKAAFNVWNVEWDYALLLIVACADP